MPDKYIICRVESENCDDAITGGRPLLPFGLRAQ